MALVDVIGESGEADLSADARRILAGVWAFRAGAERQAAMRFERLAGELADVGAQPEVTALAARAADDERRHVRLCTALADAYGGATEPESAQDSGAIGPTTLSFRDRVLYEVVAFACVTETLNTSLMTVALERARVPAVRSVLREILRDEVRHARVGWAHLAAEVGLGRGRFIADALPRMLEGAVREELFSPAPPHRESAALELHGELPETERLRIFEQTAAHVLEPGLALHGIDTGPLRRWIREKQRSTVDGPRFEA
jgi:hypothetical protein